MIRKVINLNIKIMLSQKSVMHCLFAGLFYCIVSWIQLSLVRDQVILRHVQEVVYGGVGIGGFSLIPLAKTGVYIAVYVRILANAMQQRDEVLRYCVSRCSSLRGWVLGELTSSLLLSVIWSLLILCCELCLLLIHHMPLWNGQESLVRIQVFAINLASFYSIGILYAVLNNIADRTLSISVCLLFSMTSLAVHPVSYVMPCGFCFALRNWVLGGIDGARCIEVWSVFGSYFLITMAIILQKQTNGLKRRLCYGK